jgi:hypothetical protein
MQAGLRTDVLFVGKECPEEEKRKWLYKGCCNRASATVVQ